ncbi:hypothetical protein N836_23025 [Leptolyngbya sp. Heron Island J]|nr:hypothetical protein N836_23025 [Leptolyngbya sp. Heron Island J]
MPGQMAQEDVMKSMIWKPDEEHDRQVNAYLDAENHAPYEIIWAIGIVMFCLFTAVVLIGNF